MGNKPFATALVLLALLLSFDRSVSAQGTTTRVTGTITDSTGAAVSGATVTLTSEGTNAAITTQTSDSGSYVFDLIQPGNYSVTVEKQGFKKFISTNNGILVNQPSRINAALEIGDVSASVSVQGSAEQVQTSTSGNVGSTIEQQTLESLPIVGLRGRNPLSLLNFQPGIVSGANSGGGVHVHGSRDRAFNFTLDGIDINESSAGGSNFTPLRPNPDSIQEFQIVTSNSTAELGRNSGAQVTLVTRSGTNNLRGNLFEYYQTPKVNANSYGAKFPPVTGRPQFVQHIFGGSVGGPIVIPGFGEGTPMFHVLKDRAFFFVNLQFLRASETRRTERTVYTQAARQGIFRYVRNGRNLPSVVDSSGNTSLPNCPGPLPASPCIATYNIGTNPTGVGFDPSTSAAIISTPLPNDFSRGDGLNVAGFTFNAPQAEKQYDFVGKFDFKINESNSFYVRYAQGEQDTIGDAGNSGQQPFPGFPNIVDTVRRPKNLAINYRAAPTAKLSNEFIFGYSTFTFSFDTPSPDPSLPFILNRVSDVGTNFSYNARGVRTFQWIDNLTFDLSPHVIKTGINFRFGRQFDDRSSVASSNIEPVVNFSRTINSNFNAFGLPTTAANGIDTLDIEALQSQINDFLGRVGRHDQSFIALPDGSGWQPAGSRWNYGHSYPEYDFYVQDTWKFRPNLTLDIGVRWEPKLTPASNGLPVLRPNQRVSLDSPSSNTLRWEEGKLFDSDWDNFAPSIGFAWDPFKSGKTSIRVNYRRAFDRFGTQLLGSTIFQSAPGNTFTFPTTTAFGSAGGLLRNLPVITPSGSPAQLRTPPAFGTGTTTVIDPDLVFPDVHQWFAGVQRELWWNTVLEVNYIGKKGTHLFGGYDANQVDIFATDSRFSGETFLQAFITVRGSSTGNSPLLNQLFLNDSRRLATETGSQFVRRQFATNLTTGSVASVAIAAAQRLQSGNTLLSLGGFGPFFFQKYPQFTGAMQVIDSSDNSFYNGLEFILKRRINKGIGFQIGYTLSKSEDTRSFDPVFTAGGNIIFRGTGQSRSSTPFDNRDRRLNYALSDFDRRHALQGTYVVELPFGKGRQFASDIPTVLDWVIGGWQLAGTLNLTSGRPFSVYSDANTVSNVTPSPANCNGCTSHMGSVFEELGTNYYFTAEQRALFSRPAPGEVGNTGRNAFIGPREFQTDASLTKNFRFTERFSFDLRVDAQNLTNTPSFDFPNSVLNATAPFGRIRGSVVSGPRRIQFSGKLNF